jgi:hypothetical protein
MKGVFERMRVKNSETLWGTQGKATLVLIEADEKDLLFGPWICHDFNFLSIKIIITNLS